MNPETFGWTYTEELLALIAEILDQSTRLFIMANSKKGTKPPDPLEIQRPGQPSRKEREKQVRRNPTHGEIVDFFRRK